MESSKEDELPTAEAGASSGHRVNKTSKLASRNLPSRKLPSVRKSFYVELVEGSEFFSSINGNIEGPSSHGHAAATGSSVASSSRNRDGDVAEGARGSSPPGRTRELSAIALMIGSGSFLGFFGGLLYRLSPSWALSGAEAVVSNIWLTYCLTQGVFVACTLGAGLSSTNRAALYRSANPVFLRRLLIPSSMDLLVTGLSTLALAYAQPALVGILKAAVQLAVLSAASRLVLKKKLPGSQWLCLGVVMGGVAILALNVSVFQHKVPLEGETPAILNQLIGLSLASLSGALGAWRNLAEAAILQDDVLTSGALLLAESILSALVLGVISLFVMLVVESTGEGTWIDEAEDTSLENMAAVLSQPLGLLSAVLYLLCAYGKDAAKFWLIKHTSALRQKILALLFPLGTWAISLLAFYLGGRWHLPTFGDAWDTPTSWIELFGFALILGGNVVFVLLKVKGSCPARWCARMDAC